MCHAVPAGDFYPLFSAGVRGVAVLGKTAPQYPYQAALAGINAAVVGLLLAALYQPVWNSAILQTEDFVLALLADRADVLEMAAVACCGKTAHWLASYLLNDYRLVFFYRLTDFFAIWLMWFASSRSVFQDVLRQPIPHKIHQIYTDGFSLLEATFVIGCGTLQIIVSGQVRAFSPG